MRKTPCNLFLLFILFLILPDSAMAAKRGLILLGNFRHWTDLSYDYDGQTAESAGQSTSSRQQRFEEDYQFAFDYAIYHPRILHGQFAGDIKLDQQMFSAADTSSSSNGTGLLYKLSGAALDRSPVPITFTNSIEFNHVQQEFARGYDLKVNTNGTGLSVHNNYLPITFNYSATESETSGLATDRIEKNEVFLLNATNAIGSASNTTINLRGSNIETELLGTAGSFFNRSYDLSLRNFLNLPSKGKSRSLDSGLQLHQQAGTTDYTSFSLTESLTWDLGKALSTSTSYAFNSRDASQSGTEQSHNGRFSIQHRLLESLTTQLQLDARKDFLAAGEEQELGGSLGLNYQKRLPAESNLNLAFNQRYAVDDRNLANSSITVVDEPHTVALPDRIFLNNPGVIAGSVIIKNATTGVPFALTTDYDLLPFGTQTEVVINPSGIISNGVTLLVTYSYQANPIISFATTTRRFSANLPLFNYAYRFYGSFATMNQELLAGQADVSRLTNSREYQAGFECKQGRLVYGGEYGNFDSDQDKHEYYEGRARLNRQFGRSSVGVSLSDRYTVTYPNSFTVSAIGTVRQNTVAAGTVFNRALFDTAQMLLSGNYIAVRGSLLNRDNASLALNLRWNHGKLMMALIGQVNWQLLPGTTTRDDHLRLQVTRYF
jgi:hypothetical protein